MEGHGRLQAQGGRSPFSWTSACVYNACVGYLQQKTWGGQLSFHGSVNSRFFTVVLFVMGGNQCFQDCSNPWPMGPNVCHTHKVPGIHHSTLHPGRSCGRARYLRDDVLACHEQGPQQVLTAIIPQRMDRYLGRSQGGS